VFTASVRAPVLGDSELNEELIEDKVSVRGRNIADLIGEEIAGQIKIDLLMGN
jgi:hypothetical protein